jgi:hypothetical protein
MPGGDSWKSAARKNHTLTECSKQAERISKNQVVDDGFILRTTQVDIQADKPHRSGHDGDFESRYLKLLLGLGVAKMGGPGPKTLSEVEFAVYGA